MMIKTDRDIWEDCTLETPQDSCDHCNPYPIRYFNKERNKEWVDKEELLFDLLELQRIIKEFRKTREGLQPISVKVDMLIIKINGVDE